MERALITANYGNMSNSHGIISERISLDDLMYYSLYWDRVIIPCNHGFYSQLPHEKDFIESGVVMRPAFSHGGAINSDDLQKLASIEIIEAYKGFKAQVPNVDFAIHHNVVNMFDDLTYSDLVKQDAIRVELAKFLPYPSSINIYDLLEFKEKRKDELHALHDYISNLYLDIANANHSQDLKRQLVYAELEKAITNLKASMNEQFPNKLFFKNLISELKTDVVELGATAAADTALTTFPNGTIAGGITIATKRILTTILQDQKTDVRLNFIKSSIKEGVISN